MKEHAPTSKKLLKSARNGNFLQFFTSRGLLTLVITNYLTYQQINHYWVTIEKLVKSILTTLSYSRINAFGEVAILLFRICVSSIFAASIIAILIDLLFRKFRIFPRENFVSLKKFNPLVNFKNRLSSFKIEVIKGLILILLLSSLVFFVYLIYEGQNSINQLTSFHFLLLLLVTTIAFISEILININQLNQTLRMDNQEVKNEQREEQADPILTSRLNSEYRFLILEHIEAKVKKSKVIFINNY